MTVPTNISFVTPRPAGNGVTTVFNFPFKILDVTDIVSGFVDGNGVYTPQVNGLNFFVSGVGVNTGGSVTYTIPPAYGFSVDIRSETAAQTEPQPTALTNQGKYLASSVEDAFDRITRIVQDLTRQTYTFGIHGPDQELIAWPQLPSAASRANTTLIFDSQGLPTIGVPITGTLTQAAVGSLLTPQTAAESSSGVLAGAPWFDTGNVLRYGLVPNNPAVASANTGILASLLNPTLTGITGKTWFPNTTGADVYSFNDLIPVRDGVKLDLGGSTLSFVKNASTGNEASAGFFTAIRDVDIYNGAISVNYTGGASKGSCITIGVRGSETGLGAFFPNTYDASLTTPQGNCHLYKLRLTTNNPLGLHIQLTGGINNSSFKNILMNGQGVADGIDYEFGWATSGTTNLRQTSHAHNLSFENILLVNGGATSTALTLTGAYNATVDGLYTDQVGSLILVNPGESLFYRPWVPVDVVGIKRDINLRNLVGSRIGATGMTLAGAARGSTTYLSAIIAGLSATAQSLAQTGLLNVSVDGFVLDGSVNAANGYGLEVSAGRAHIKNGFINGAFQRGIVGTDECTNLVVDGVAIAGCTQQGIQAYGSIDGGAALWSPQRLKKGEIKNCFIAGNSTATIGGTAGIDLQNCDGMLIENNRIGYDVVQGGSAEATQGNGVQIDASCSNVICRGNKVYVAPGVGAIAYYNSDNTPPGQGNIVESASGTTTMGGIWQDGVSTLLQLTYTATMTMDASLASDYFATILDGGNFTIAAPTNPRYGQLLALTIRNTFGTLGTVTFNAIFKQSAWTSPANGYSRTIRWRFNNVNWVQVSQTGVDVPN